MLIMNGHVEIGKHQIKGINSVEVSSSWEQLTDTCSITIPKKLTWGNRPIVFSGNNVYGQETVNVETRGVDDDLDFVQTISVDRLSKEPLLKKGDAVSVNLGYAYDSNTSDNYDDGLRNVFLGYLTQIQTGKPIVLNCQDEMWKLKQNEFKASYRNVTLSQILSDMSEVTDFEFFTTADWNIGSYRTKTGHTPAKVLEDLRKDYFIKFFFREGVFYGGLPYVAELQTRHVIRFNRHVIDDNLEYMVKEDIKIKMKCVILYPNNKKEEFELGDTEGEVRTFNKYDIPKAEMKRLAEIEMERLRYDGYRGSVTIFGAPHIKHGDIVKFINPEEPERTGEYLIKRVDIKFSQNGYRQILYPEGRVS
jgi:hypothetical protein